MNKTRNAETSDIPVGKPYQSELKNLPEVYDWAMSTDIGPLKAVVGALAAQPLLAIGSGGSLTAAAAASHLHFRYAQKVAHTVTPLEAVSLPSLPDAGILITTGGGRNPDVLGCFRQLVEREPLQLAVICAAVGTPLADLVATYWYARLYEFSPPSRKDGFIATNSLLSTVVLLVRAYQELYGDQPLASTWAEFWNRSNDVDRVIEQSATIAARFDSFLVLYGPSTYPAALDLESKCTETGLASVQLADYRNFAHGRHHGLKVRSSTTAVVALQTNDDRDLALRTLKLLPKSIAVSSIDIESCGADALVASLVAVIKWVGALGARRGIDPGRPSVAQFGRKLYHLNSFRRSGSRAPDAAHLAIERKTKTSIERLLTAGSLGQWESALEAAVKRYEAARFGAIVFDYDGTLCAPKNRFDGIEDEMAQALARVLRKGLIVGIATGRGKSVREDLASQIPRKFWDQVWIGYYNGGQMGLLSDGSQPNKAVPGHPALERLMETMKADGGINTLMTIDRSSNQLTIFPRAFKESDVWHALVEICRQSDHALVRSSHSFDVLAPGVSKLNVVRKVAELVDRKPILRIGDLGRWPGNDHELLADEFGLSVDQVSIHPGQCWNFAKAGYRGTQATLEYLNAIKFGNSGAAMDLAALGLGAR